MKFYPVYLAIALVFTVTSCKNMRLDTPAAVSESNTTSVTQEEPEETLIVEQVKPENIIGKFSKEDLLEDPYSIWYTKNYSAYNVDEEKAAALKLLLNDVEVTTFMGTWCGDSKREVPRFYKILESAGIETSDISLIGVTRQKNTPDGLEKGLEITNVPTFIFTKDGKEIGRIVEYPIESLEADMLKILKGEAYKHAYED